MSAGLLGNSYKELKRSENQCSLTIWHSGNERFYLKLDALGERERPKLLTSVALQT